MPEGAAVEAELFNAVGPGIGPEGRYSQDCAYVRSPFVSVILSTRRRGEDLFSLSRHETLGGYYIRLVLLEIAASLSPKFLHRCQIGRAHV